MRVSDVRRTSRVLASVAAVAALLLLASVELQAQTGRRSVPAGARPRDPAVRPPSPHQQKPPSVREREFIYLGMEMEAKKPPTEEQQRLALLQIAEDYREIQQVNNRMMAAAMKQGAALDYAGISDSTSEIRKRALRLRDNFALPKPDKLDKKVTEPKVGDEAQFKQSLLLLDKYLMSFVNSQIFKSMEVYDAQAATKAGQDLASVIELSRVINEAAAKLVRPAKTKP